MKFSKNGINILFLTVASAESSDSSLLHLASIVSRISILNYHRFFSRDLAVITISNIKTSASEHISAPRRFAAKFPVSKIWTTVEELLALLLLIFLPIPCLFFVERKIDERKPFVFNHGWSAPAQCSAACGSIGPLSFPECRLFVSANHYLIVKDSSSSIPSYFLFINGIEDVTTKCSSSTSCSSSTNYPTGE